MKVFYVLLMFAMIGMVTSCEDNSPSEELVYESTGTITGYDLTLCACCGGWIVVIENDENTYRLDSLPEGSGIDNEDLPLTLDFNWSINRVCGTFIYLDVEGFELN